MKFLFTLSLLFLSISLSIAQITDADGNWASQDTIIYDTPEADIMVRVGDIDNLGFGWPANFDPFSGNNTPGHSFPWTFDTTNAPGTDRIMVPTSYVGTPPAGRDGYVSSTSRPGNIVEPITLYFDLQDVEIQSAILQIFVDDFQAPVWQADYEVRLNGLRIPLLESIINELRQTGPIGKIISAQIPSDFVYLLNSDSLQILIDDYTTGAGDGFAIDFAKLLINPKEIAQIATINGTIKDSNTGLPIDSVLVVANGAASAYSDSLGFYSIDSVLAGLVSVQTFKTGYGSQVQSVSVASGGTATVNFNLQNPAPFVVNHTPADSAYSISIDSTIQVWFSQPIDTSTIKSFTFYMADSTGIIPGDFIKEDSSVIFIPDTFNTGREYVVTLTTGITNEAGVAMDTNYKWRFFSFAEPVISAINTDWSPKPSAFDLYPAFPNPFNPTTTIRYDLRMGGKVEVKLFNTSGQLIKEIFSGVQSTGNYFHVIDFTGVSSGSYYVQIKANSVTKTQKVLFLK